MTDQNYITETLDGDILTVRCEKHDITEKSGEHANGWQWFRMHHDRDADTVTPKCLKCERGNLYRPGN